ncbi:MAG: Zn-ribbon domain-containing OB-fold protein [Candidatus Hydrogenedentes bacterium]|nr:Zn-ribbon domain-containing OB-fold protein [Candidatus Hydrogenedentota bacterium]
MEQKHEWAYVIEGKMALPYQYFAGAVGSRFIAALRDGKKVLGVRCERCATTFVPPRQTCERCFADLTNAWVELGTEGIVTGFTVVRYAEPYQPKQPPYVLALVQLDGADTPIAHLLECGDPSNARVGMRVRAVFSDDRKDNILEIRHFEPLP